jgi:hypothetical protein
MLHLSKRAEISTQRRAELEGAISTAHAFLVVNLGHRQEKARGDLEAAVAVLGERMARAVERGRSKLDGVLGQLGQMQWNSLKVKMTRGGRYGKDDLSVDIARPVLDSIAFAYSDFFGERLAGILDQTTDALIRVADDHRRALLDAIVQLGLPGQQWNDDLKKLLDVTQKVIAEQTAQVRVEMAQKIHEDRAHLHEGIIDQVRVNMAGPVREAGKVSGKGTKARIIELVSEYAHSVANAMFREVEENLTGRVRGLCAWLDGKFAEMAGTVERHTALSSENLRGGTADAGVPIVDDDRVGLERLCDVVASLSLDDPIAA